MGGLLLAGLAARPAPAATKPVAPAAGPRLRALFGRPFFRRLTLSPRAHALAFVVPSRHHRRRVVEVLDLKTLLSHGRMRLKASETFPRGVRVSSLTWVSPHLLFVVTRRPSPAGTIGFGLLDDRLPRHAYKPLRIFDGSGNGPASRVAVVATPSVGPVLLWRAAPFSDPVLYRYDLAMGRLRRFCRVPLAGARVLVDARGWPRLAALTGSRGPAPEVLVSRGRCASWVSVTGRFRRPDLRRYDRFLALGPRGQGVYFLAPSPTPARTLGLDRFGLTHFGRTALVASPHDDVYESHRGRWISLVWGRHHRRLVGVDFMPGRPRVFWIHPRDPLVRLLRGLGHELNGEVVRVRGSGPHGRVLLLETLGDRNPGRYYLYARRPTPSLTFLMARHPALHESAMVPLRPVLIPEGKRVLHAYLARPRRHGPGPVVLLAHGGGLGSRFVWFYDPLIQCLARAGYTVVAVNTHGSGGYGTLYESPGLHDPSDVVPDDLAAAALWALHQRLARPGSIAVLGRGTGGEAALLAAARFPALFRAVVSIGTGADRPLRAAGSPGEHGGALRSPAHAERTPSLRQPVLFVRFSGSGHKDRGQRALFLRLHREGHPVVLDSVPSGTRPGLRWADALHAVLRFLAHHLGTLSKPVVATGTGHPG